MCVCVCVCVSVGANTDIGARAHTRTLSLTHAHTHCSSKDTWDSARSRRASHSPHTQTPAPTQMERPSGQTPPLKAPRRFFAEGEGSAAASSWLRRSRTCCCRAVSRRCTRKSSVSSDDRVALPAVSGSHPPCWGCREDGGEGVGEGDERKL